MKACSLVTLAMTLNHGILIYYIYINKKFPLFCSWKFYWKQVGQYSILMVHQIFWYLHVNCYCVHINSIFTASLEMHGFLDWYMLRRQQFVITLRVDYITKPLKIVVMQMIIDGLLMVVKVTVFSQIY